MTTFAASQDQPRLHALETRTKEAWSLYREHLSDLDGIAYLEAEKAEWEHLQTDLREIATERAALAQPTGDGVHGVHEEPEPPG